MKQSSKTPLTFAKFMLLVIAFAAVYTGCCMAMTGCNTAYEFKKGHGCYGATGIPEAQASYRPRR